MSNFLEELCSLINRHSLENGSNTPDYILAGYLKQCLDTFDSITQQREMWHGRQRPDMHDDPFGIRPEDDDPEPNPDCPPQEYRIPDDMASNIVAPSFDASPFLDIMDSPLEESPLVQQIKRRVEQELNQEVEEACDELGISYPEPTPGERRLLRSLLDRIEREQPKKECKAGNPHFDKEQAASGIDALAQYASSPEKQVRTAARLWRDTVRNLDHSNIIRATSEMRTIIARIEAEATETEDDGA